jgi:hypothetical protein
MWLNRLIAACAAALLGAAGAGAAASEPPAGAHQRDARTGAGEKGSKPKARPAPRPDRQKALNEFSRALAILRAAGKLPEGKPGYIGETAQREKDLRALKDRCEARRDFSALAEAAEQIISEYDASMKAHR